MGGTPSPQQKESEDNKGMDNTVKFFHLMRLQSLEEDLGKKKKIYNLIKHTEDNLVSELKEEIDYLEKEVSEVKELLKENGVRL